MLQFPHINLLKHSTNPQSLTIPKTVSHNNARHPIIRISSKNISIHMEKEKAGEVPSDR